MIRVFPRKTKWVPVDELAFIGDPPLWRPPQQPVKISVTFTWDIPEGQRLFRAWSGYYQDVKIGGPAFNDAGGEFMPGQFIKQGVTITSRGCNKKCKWCFVPKREGCLRELQIKEGWIIQDNNLLQCSQKHIERVFDMLKNQPHPAEFKGGLDATLIKDWHYELFKSIKIKSLWFACDTDIGLKSLEKVAEMLTHINRSKKYCYALIGLDKKSLDNDKKRLEHIYNLGFLPFAQLFQGECRQNYSKEWRQLARTFSRPAATKAYMKGR